MNLILIRHGETQENIDGIVQGWLNSELNENGKRQAKVAADNFNDSIDAIYSSDLKRCIQTAEYFKNRYPDIPFHTDKRLRERNFGDAQNTHKDLHDWEAFWSLADTVTIPNAETLNNFTLRVSHFLEHLRATHSNNESVLVVTHGGTINRILDILGLSDDYKAVKNCESLYLDLA